MGPLDVECIHDAQQIVGEIARIGDDRPRTRATDPAVIVQDDPELARKIGHLRRPETTTAAEPGNEQHGIAGYPPG